LEKRKKRWLIWIATVLVLGVVAILAWRRYGADNESASLASGNGRIEATEIDVATKIAGRVKEVLVREGDFVMAGQVVARMDTEVLDAQQLLEVGRWAVFKTRAQEELTSRKYAEAATTGTITQSGS
jgi:HlyD family secretion protein